jgi:HlyD family secretion protein
MKNPVKQFKKEAHKVALLMGSLCLIALLSGCHGTGILVETAHEEVKKEEKAAIKLPAIVATGRDVPRTISIPGVVSALPDHSVKVTPTIAGKLVSVLVVPGQRVSRGQVIAKLNDQHVIEQLDQSKAAVEAAQANASQAKENLDYAKNNRDRQQHLYQAEVGAGKDLILAENQVQTAQAQLNAALAQIKSAKAAHDQIETERQYTSVHAPIAGVVSNRYLNVGDTADLNSPIVQLVDLQKVVVNAGLPADTTDRVHVGEHATISDIAHPDTVYDGKLTVVSPEVDPQSNTIRVQLECLNTDGELREGQTVTVVITSRVDRGAILVPENALVPNPDNPEQEMIYVVADGKAKRLAVSRGTVVDHQVEITGGLKAGQVVLTSGAYGLPDGCLVEPEIKQ